MELAVATSGDVHTYAGALAAHVELPSEGLLARVFCRWAWWAGVRHISELGDSSLARVRELGDGGGEGGYKFRKTIL